MSQIRTESARSLLVTATAASKGLGSLPLCSALSRAAARALVASRREREAENESDRPLDVSGLAERLNTARKRCESEVSRDWTPIVIPPGKENTVRGRLAARMNAARARMAMVEAEQ
jgi:hypothetical protein